MGSWVLLSEDGGFSIYILVIDAVILCLLFSTDYTMYVYIYILMYIYIYIYIYMYIYICIYIYMWFFNNWMLNTKNSLASMVLEVF